MYVCREALNVIILRVKLTGITRDNKIIFIFFHTNSGKPNSIFRAEFKYVVSFFFVRRGF